MAEDILSTAAAANEAELDDNSKVYLDERQFAQELHSPGAQAIRHVSTGLAGGEPQALSEFEEDEVEQRRNALALTLVGTGLSKEEVTFQMGEGSPGLQTPLYDPIDLIVDIFTGGLFGRGRAGLKLLQRGIKESASGTATAGAKQVGQAVAADVTSGAVFTGLAGGFMSLTELAGAGPLLQGVSALIGPIATKGLMTASRTAFNKFIRELRTNNPDLLTEMKLLADETPDNAFAKALKEELGEDVAEEVAEETAEAAVKKKGIVEKAVDLVRGKKTDKPGVPRETGEQAAAFLGKEFKGEPEILTRVGEVDFDKPQGLFLAKEGSDIISDLRGTKTFFEVSPKNPLVVQSEDLIVKHAERGRGLSFPASAGIKALKQMVGDDEFNRLLKLSSQELLPELNKKFPDVKWNKFFDSYEMLEGLSGKLARQKGHDAIIGDIDETIILKKSATTAIPRETIEPELIIPKRRGPLVTVSSRELDERATAFLGLDAPDISEKAININFKNIRSTDDIKEAIAKTGQLFGKEIDEARRGVITNVETQRLASLTGLDVQTLLKRQKGEAFNAETAVAARRILVSSADNLSASATKMMAGEATDADRADFARLLALHSAIQAQVSGLTAEAGRLLQAFNIPVTTAKSKLLQLKELTASLPKGTTLDDVADAIASMDSPEGVGRFMKDLRRATTSDMFLEAWINGLLSGPKTQIVNLLGNTLFAAWQIPERAIAAQIGRLTGGPRAITTGEAVAQAYGLVQGMMDGLRAAGKTLITGEPTSELTKLELRRFKAITAENVAQTLPGKLLKKVSSVDLETGGKAAWAVDFIGSVVRLPGRGLMAGDELFKAIGYRMELNARAYRTAVDENLTGDAMTKRIQGILDNPPDDIKLAAVDASTYQTFTKPLGEAGKKFQNITNLIPALKLVIPFFRTPVNIVKSMGERTPLAFLSKSIRADLQAGGARRDLALARVGTGTVLMVTGGMLASAGYITGGGPSDPGLRANLRRQGWQEYSVFIPDGTTLSSGKPGGRFVAYNRLEPLGMLLGISADVADVLKDIDDGEEAMTIASSAVIALSKNVTSKTYMRGMSDLLNVFSDPDRYAEKYVSKFLSSGVPNISAQLTRTLDPERKAVFNWWDQLRSRIPNNELLPKLNVWGETSTFDSFGPNVLSPIYQSKAKDSPIDAELERLGESMPRPRRSLTHQGVTFDLEPKEYNDLIVLMNTINLSSGKPLKQTLNEMVQTDRLYQGSSEDRKGLMIRQWRTEAKERATQELLRVHPVLQQVIDARHRQLQRPAQPGASTGAAPVF